MAPMLSGTYLDWAAAAPPDASWLDAGTAAAMECYANPSSPHAPGRAARERLESARSAILSCLGGKGMLSICSGATEANAIALQAALLPPGQAVLAYSSIEHASVHDAARGLERLGARGVAVACREDGIVDPRLFGRAAGKGARLAALMAINNETGAIQDIPGLVAELRALPRGSDIRIHVDATQALGRLTFDPWALGVDSVAFSVHKLGGPRGIGFLWTRSPLDVLARGGGQEWGIRPGTENLAGAVAASMALGAATAAMEAERARVTELAARALEGIRALGGIPVPACRTVRDERYSPWILQARLPGIPAEVLVRVLSDRGVYISTGSACSSRKRERRVLAAMGLDEDEALSAFRVSFGRLSRAEDVERFLEALSMARRSLGAP